MRERYGDCDQYAAHKQSNGQLIVSDGTNSLVFINSDGNMSIGTSDPIGVLHIHKKGHSANEPGGGIIFTRYTENSSYRGAAIWNEYLGNQDYLVFTIDGRGSENRGKDFEQIIFKNLGQIEMRDQIKGYNYLKSLQYVDVNRIALHGWSYGGFMTTNLLLSYPDLFTCGVAGGPVTDWELYEVMYTERYMETPLKNPDGYHNTKLMNKVKNLKSNLLMIHGLIDDVVVIQHSLKFLV